MARFWDAEPGYWDQDATFDEALRLECLQHRYYQYMDAFEATRTLIITGERIAPHQRRTYEIRQDDWFGTLQRWPEMYRNMSPSHMLPCRISREHLEGWPPERTRYFLEHLRARHAEVKAELDKKLGQIHEFFKFKNSDGWRTILERVAEWRNW